MKIIRDNKVYVQNKDLIQLMSACAYYKIAIPSEVIDKVFNKIFIVDDENYYDYVCFNGKETIKFFDSLPYIIDYDKIKNLSEEEIISLIRQAMDDATTMCNEFNGLEEKEKEKKYDDANTSVHLLETKCFDLRNILWEKQGHVKLSMPKEFSIGYKLKMIFNKDKNK